MSEEKELTENEERQVSGGVRQTRTGRTRDGLEVVEREIEPQPQAMKGTVTRINL